MSRRVIPIDTMVRILIALNYSYRIYIFQYLNKFGEILPSSGSLETSFLKARASCSVRSSCETLGANIKLRWFLNSRF